MTHPHVSIVIPAFDAEATLGETLGSLQAQTERNWEAIVVDDGSTDATFDVAATAATEDERVRVVRQANGGESAARNAGLVYANSDWLVFLDADDWLRPRFLERMIQATSAEDDPDVLHCGWVAVSRDGRRGVDRLGPSDEDLFPALTESNCLVIHTCLVRRALLDRVGCFDVGLKTCADWDVWQRIARTGARFQLVRDVLACYRLRPGSAGTHARQLMTDALTVISRGHAPDARVLHPSPPYAMGMSAARVPRARLQFLCWAAGLSIGRGESTEPLFELVGEASAPLAPELVSEILFESVPIPGGDLPTRWVDLWPEAEDGVDVFLSRLEDQAKTPGLAARAKSCLMGRILGDAVPAVLASGPAGSRNGHLRNGSMTAPSAGSPIGATSGGAPRVPDTPFALRRLLEPVSREWGYDRGRPVDRFYIERFLASHAGDVAGRVLEIGDNAYTLRYGGDRVTRSDVLHVEGGNPHATIVSDLARGDGIPSGAFDCVILTQTLQLIYDFPAALGTVARILRPGGVLLASFPGLTRRSMTEWPGAWFWRFTPESALRLVERAFAHGTVQVTSHGNVLAACAFLYGLAVEDLTTAELDHYDPEYDVIVTVRAVKDRGA